MPDKSSKPMQNKEDIPQHPDHKIDQDFEGYPHGPASDKSINPQTKSDEKVADMDHKDGEKMNRRETDEVIDEQDSDGSANAFDDK